MTPFTLDTTPTGQPGEALLAGGTTVPDLMTCGTPTPARLIARTPRRATLSAIEDVAAPARPAT